MYYTVTLEINSIQSDGPADAAREFKKWIEDGEYIVSVKNESTGESFTFDF